MFPHTKGQTLAITCLVNMICQKHLEGIYSNMEQTFTFTVALHTTFLASTHFMNTISLESHQCPFFKLDAFRYYVAKGSLKQIRKSEIGKGVK